MEHFLTYFTALQAANLAEITEHSLRPELKNLLSAIASGIDKHIAILHEGKRQSAFGAPDFTITRLTNIIGYVENKKVGEPLEPILKSDQIKKYQQLSGNILLTNYLDWIWLHHGNVQRATLCAVSDLDQKLAKLVPTQVAAVEELVRGFLSFAPEGVGKPKELAKALALRGKVLKEFLAEELQRQTQHDTKGKLFGLYEIFQTYVFHELTLEEFADAFSQNLIYGLFLAKLNADTTAITLSNAEEFIPANFELILELVDFLKDLKRKEYTDIRWVIEEVVTIFNTMNLRDIKIALSFKDLTGCKNLSGLAENDDPYAVKDPYIYFYEDFLAAYDKHLRKSKGVYYTPPQVVNFIVRAVHDILKDTFHLPDGLADHERVTVLDFAVGTGTFLLEVMRQIFEQYPDKTMQELLIKEHLLKHLYGFEYLIAPYTIAHLKLSQFLKDRGYTLGAEERFQIFLTNTLEPADRQLNIPMLPALTKETKAAQKVKETPILVILGNPPYSYHSKNPSETVVTEMKAGKLVKRKEKTAIGKLLQDYYTVDGRKLDEKNPKGLQDDYVKFIRFAQDKMEYRTVIVKDDKGQERIKRIKDVREGMVAIITNHAFLDNPTFRGMRQSLMQTFDQMYFIDLHGSVKKKEHTPDGGNDENVFDIEPGVAISILVKKAGLEKKVYRADFWGTRENKYMLCVENSLKSVDWDVIQPSHPHYLFTSIPFRSNEHYRQFQSISAIFQTYASGVKTHDDENLIGFDESDLARRVADKYQIVITSGLIRAYQYRPFDQRKLYYDTTLVKRARENQNAFFLAPNLGLMALRQAAAVGSDIFDSVFIVDTLVDTNVFRRGGPLIFPLFHYQQSIGLFAPSTEQSVLSKIENFTKDFRQFIDRHYQQPFPPETILGYIYAVLHSPTYRAKYAEFLKIDFPRIPFIKDLTGFEHLSRLGWQLIQAHLLKEIPAYNLGAYQGDGDHTVGKPEYRPPPHSSPDSGEGAREGLGGSGRLYINATQYFAPVPEAVYRFQIGGYQVLDKYLKDRKGRALSLSEVKNISQVVNVLAFTLDQMQKIDEMTKTWI